MKWKFRNKINKRKLKAQWIVITFLINIYLSRMKIRKIIRFDIFLVPVRLENPFNLPSHNRISTPHFTLIMILNAHALIGKIIIHECQESWQDRSPRLSATFFFEDYAKGNGRTIRSYLPSTNKISTESNLAWINLTATGGKARRRFPRKNSRRETFLPLLATNEIVPGKRRRY